MRLWLCVVLLGLPVPGCAQLGLVQSSPSTDVRTSGSVRILGPLLHPQRLEIPASGLSLDHVLAAAQRPGAALGSLGNVEMVYRQRGATRLFVPVMLIRQTALGSIVIRDRDVVGCLKLTETPIFNTSPGTNGQEATANVSVKGLLTAGKLSETESASPGYDADGDLFLRMKSSGTAPVTLQLIDQVLAMHAASSGSSAAPAAADVVGVTAGVTTQDGYIVNPDIVVISRIGTDGYVEQYVFPRLTGNSEPNPFEGIAHAAFSRTPILDGDIIDFTLIELFPEAVSGSIRSTLRDTQNLTGAPKGVVRSDRCQIQPGPLLRPLDSLVRSSASQTSAVFLSVSAPTIDLFRRNSAIPNAD